MADAGETRKLSLILSGAVSLGSFEAGVLLELLYTLEYLAANGGPRFQLDVMTGASAGSMTAAVVARALAHDFRYRTFLHDAWIDRIDIRALTTSIPPAALLCSAPIDQISRDFLVAPPMQSANRPRIAPDRLFLTFMLSNMNGVDFVLQTRIREDAQFTSTFYSERRRFTLVAGPAASGGNLQDAALWERMRQAAVCSGNFPIAFLPRMMASDADAVLGMCGPMPCEYCYVDGGMFNNEPIKEAVELSAEADNGAVAPNRKFLLVDANLNHSSADSKFNAGEPFLSIAKRLAGMVMGEMGANDWLRAQRVNTEIGWRDELVTHLAGMVRDNEVAHPDVLPAQLDATARGVIEDKRTIFPLRYQDTETELKQGLAETRAQHAEHFRDLTTGRQAILERMLFLLNSVAGLQKKTRLDIDLIYAEPGETAGDRLFSFGGFFERKWREHDYRIGRAKARALLPGMLGFEAGTVPPEPGPNGENVYKPDHDYSQVDMKDADRHQREILRDSMAHKFGDLARQHAPWYARLPAGLIASAIVKDKVGKLLEL